MGYIGVPQHNQENFHAKVIESRSNFSDYTCPTTKEEYWSTVDTYWKPLKNIINRYYKDVSDETLTELFQTKHPRLATYFEYAWISAPDDGTIHLIPAWHILCDLCSESYLLYEESV